ncbi:hypothetical protein DCS_06985 [Drechmeria coniospora]|uniref:Protein kinase domain-containing protein n=1 Tax=Drechmeria coniospora TaxID=98403 RepID=A0A151GD82_DRECN|nr:hypothetical protein DCS_06985 [Drechmeria coniospora]KYK55024.1 hypothetical protein DCS_06985 [Drechmeria coniospora]
MSSQNSVCQPCFELVEEVDEGIWIAVKPGEPQAGRFLARRIDKLSEQQRQAVGSLMGIQGQGSVVGQVLGHRNLVSLVGHMEQPGAGTNTGPSPPCGAGADFFLWDLCEAGSLGSLLSAVPNQPNGLHLAESLCWHVLRALLGAVVHLHDGKSLVVHRAGAARAFRWLSVREDWHPILHRSIDPGHIYFQLPRGNETYGLCKLGHSAAAAVTGHVISPHDDDDDEDDGGNTEAWPSTVAVSIKKGWEPLAKTRDKIGRDPETWPVDERPYTLSDELWSIGSVVFTMMTGSQLALVCDRFGCAHVTKCSEGGCLRRAAHAMGCRCVAGGCPHLPRGDCSHAVADWERMRDERCGQGVINVDTNLARAPYSHWLRDAVRCLLEFDPASKLLTSTASRFATMAEIGFRHWREGTEEGRSYVDVDDEGQ